MNTSLNGVYQRVVSAAGPLRVGTGSSQVAVSGYSTNAIGCAIVKDGSVWCFPIRDVMTDSTYLGNNGGMNMTVSQAQQVQSSVDGTMHLSNMVQIAGGTQGYASFCAVDASGNPYCWGYNGQGQLGTGDTGTLTYAQQVKTSPAATFGGVAEIRLSYYSACARTTDKNIWCWGSNSNAELAQPTSTQFTGNSNYYPTKVTNITGVATATKLIESPAYTFCAVMSDTTALCWGQNVYGQAGAPTATGYVSTPNTVLQTMGGAPWTGITDIINNGPYSVCARTNQANNPIICWGNVSAGGANAGPYPINAVDSNQQHITGIQSPFSGGYYTGLSYVDLLGRVAAGASSNVPQPSCNNLIPAGQ
jgi:alpha-tubulin suppressor-like RCC1 family protein